MTLLNDTEKVTFLINLLDHHIKKLSKEDIFANYLESIRIFLKTKDSILQKAAFSNSELIIDNLSYTLGNRTTYRQAIGTLVAAFEKVGFTDSMEAAAIILEYEQLLIQMTSDEAENIYKERWETNGKESH
ncbi:hypothetical protein [Paenibacillus elgii]|uniref:hypothetical protein n=1 Tax=Paenibacillus elgii TaxID=189691 RepID=UPI0030DC6DAE